MDKKSRNIIIVVAVAGLLLYLYNKNKSKFSTGSDNELPNSTKEPELSYEKHTFGLIAEEIQEKGKSIGVDEELVNQCKPQLGGWKWQKCFDTFGKNKSIDTLMRALEIIDKEEPTKEEIKKFNKLMLQE